MSLNRPTLRTAASIAAWTLAAAWVMKTLSVARNLRRVPNLATPEWDRTPDPPTSIAVIVPARNEEGNVEASLLSLLAQDQPDLHIVAVDDRSIDSTAAEMAEVAALAPERLRVVSITDLPGGWLGKTHAMHAGAAAALAQVDPDWILFTDADILFHPETLRRALVFAQQQQADHVVVLPTPILRSAGEAIFLGFLQIVGFWALRLWRIPDPQSRDAIGVGAFNLLSKSALSRIGGLEPLRLQVVEDVALGRRVKRLGLRQRVAFAPGFVRLHWAPGIAGILRTMTKNLFAIYCYDIPLVLGASAGLLVLCLGPVAGLFSRQTRRPSLLATAAIGGLYVATAPSTRMPAWTALGFPVGAVLLVAGTVRSCVLALWRQGIEWRGTTYPLATLRRDADCIASPRL